MKYRIVQGHVNLVRDPFSSEYMNSPKPRGTTSEAVADAEHAESRGEWEAARDAWCRAADADLTDDDITPGVARPVCRWFDNADRCEARRVREYRAARGVK